MKFDFTIVTPSYNMLSFLKLCHKSIVDQQGVRVEHVVIDGLSGDNTPEWLEEQSDLRYISEKDEGMYDALNKGFSSATGDFIGYLNCDEQYLPDVLAKVKRCFDENPELDVVFGDTLYISSDGSLISFRKAYPLKWYLIPSSYLYVMTCSIFFRNKGNPALYRFSKEFREVGDADLITRLLRQGIRFMHMREYIGAFTLTNKNAMLSDHCLQERKHFLAGMPFWVRWLKVPLVAFRLLLKTLSGSWQQKFPLRYAIYTMDHADSRKIFEPNYARALLLGTDVLKNTD